MQDQMWQSVSSTVSVFWQGHAIFDICFQKLITLWLEKVLIYVELVVGILGLANPPKYGHFGQHYLLIDYSFTRFYQARFWEFLIIWTEPDWTTRVIDS